MLSHFRACQIATDLDKTANVTLKQAHDRLRSEVFGSRSGESVLTEMHLARAV